MPTLGVFHVGEIIHQNDLVEQFIRCTFENRVDRPEQHGPGLVVEADDHRRVWQVVVVLLRFASANLPFCPKTN